MGKYSIDTTITFITRVLQLFIGIGTSIIIARVLGPQGKGIYSLAILLPMLIINFGNLGVGQASIFYIGKKKYPLQDILANNILCSIYFGIAGSVAGLIISYFLGSALFPGVSTRYLFIASILIPFMFFINFINSILLGTQKIKEYNFINILQSALAFILLLFFLLILHYKVIGAIVATILSYLLVLIVLFHIIKKIIGIHIKKMNTAYLKDTFRYGSKVYIGNIIQFLHYKIDIFLINLFLNPTSVGYYSISVSLAEKIWLISQSAGVVLFPKVSSETDQVRLKEFTPFIFRTVLVITFLAAIILLFVGRLLILLFYSSKFAPSIKPFQILLIGTVTMGGWKILANDLYGRGKPEVNILISLVSVLTNVLLNIIWIPKFGISGAAWATSISYTLSLLAIIVVYSKISENKILSLVLFSKSDLASYKNIISSFLKTKKSSKTID